MWELQLYTQAQKVNALVWNQLPDTMLIQISIQSAGFVPALDCNRDFLRRCCPPGLGKADAPDNNVDHICERFGKADTDRNERVTTPISDSPETHHN